MKQEEEINVNRVNYRVYEAMIRACLADYTHSFNELKTGKEVRFEMTITPASVKVYDVLLRQGTYKTVEEMEKAGITNETVEVRYLRLAKFFEHINHRIPVAEEFLPGFIYQVLDVVKKVWVEEQFLEGDIIPVVELDKDQVRVAKRVKEKDTIIYQQSIRLASDKEVLNDKWWKRVLYLDLLNTLLAKGVEYGEVLEVLKRGEEEKSILAKELGSNMQAVLDANKIVLRKEMPKPLTKEDEQYKAQMAVARKKDSKK